MTDNVKNINQISKELEKLLKEKQSEYGNFNSTSYVFKGVLESILSAFNGTKVH